MANPEKYPPLKNLGIYSAAPATSYSFPVESDSQFFISPMENPEKYPPSKKLAIDSAAPATGDSFPVDLLQEILLNLSVRSILRLRAVSKTWLSLISSPRFVDSQLRRARSVTDETIIGRRNSDNNANTISLLHLDSPQLEVDLELPYSKGDLPVWPLFQLVGSCNGIVCVVFTDLMREKHRIQKIYLWNPATKHSKLISPPTLRNDVISAFYGFGFDSIGNDFKVVRIVFFNGVPTCSEVYSANKNAWREVECGVRGTHKYPIFYASVEGALYSMWSRGILRFDLNTEVFNYYDISYPESVRPMYSNTRVFQYKDSIAVLIYQEINSEISLWKVDDACLCGGSEGSWTRIFSSNLELEVDWVHGYLNSGHILVKDWDNMWFLCDINTEEMTYVPYGFYVRETFKYTESLVSIRGFKQVEWITI